MLTIIAQNISMSISTQQRALVAIMSAAGRLRRQAGCLFEGHGISSSQYNVLRILRGAGGELPTMTIRDRMMDPEPSITRLVDRLEKRGLLERVACAEDRRRVDCRLTEAGTELLSELDKPVDDADRQLMRGLSERELKTLADLLDRVAQGEPEGA